jgi:hypothetical protein
MAKSESTGLPLDLSRSLLVIIIPGAVATTPWILLLSLKYESLIKFYDDHEVTGNVVLFVLAVLVGSIIENLGTIFEVRWDMERESTLNVTENWYKYLSRVNEHEPVGYNYLSSMATTLYFELSMMFALPSLFIGLALVFEIDAHLWPVGTALLAFGIGALLCAFYFYRWAKDSHQVLCKTRLEINKRLDAAPSSHSQETVQGAR